MLHKVMIVLNAGLVFIIDSIGIRRTKVTMSVLITDSTVECSGLLFGFYFISLTCYRGGKKSSSPHYVLNILCVEAVCYMHRTT